MKQNKNALNTYEDLHFDIASSVIFFCLATAMVTQL